MIPDKGYRPMYLYYKEFVAKAEAEGAGNVKIALERGKDEVAVFETVIFDSAEKHSENFRFLERIAKFMLWGYGGYKFYISGADEYIDELSKCYSPSGDRAFDFDFMRGVYLRDLIFTAVSESDFPEAKTEAKPVSLKGEGKRIGFDAGGSDRKVTALENGVVVYENETVWNPKLNSDPQYHIDGIADSIDKALEKLGGVDAIGVSTAGIVVDDEVRVASLFRKVPKELFPEKIFPIYKNLSEKYGCPVKVANDGDVAALSGAYSLRRGGVLGIAMGTSLAGGYIDRDMRILGYLNELAFAPVDENPDAARDDWSGDAGVGGMYHSQDAVIKLAPEVGIELDPALTPAEKLKVVQKLAEQDDPRAMAIFTRLGDYAAYTLMWFNVFYDYDTAIFMGRVTSGKGGDRLIERAKEVLNSEGSHIAIELPDEMSRRLGQSYTAALL